MAHSKSAIFTLEKVLGNARQDHQLIVA